MDKQMDKCKLGTRSQGVTKTEETYQLVYSTFHPKLGDINVRKDIIISHFVTPIHSVLCLHHYQLIP